MDRITTRIREIRKTRGLTLQQLADKVGTTAQTIQRLETDNMSVSVDWLERIAPALGVSAAGLLNETPNIRAVRYAGELGLDCIVRYPASEAEDRTLPIDVPGREPIAVRLRARLGPYETGTLLVADRIADDARKEADGRDCLVSVRDDRRLLFRRIVFGREGLAALVPYEAAGAVDRNLAIAWIAPVLMSVRYF